MIGLRVVFVLAAVWMDLHSGRIRNGWILAGGILAMGRAVALALISGGAAPLWEAMEGALIPFGLLFPFFCLRGIGAGDVKLLMVLGALLGPEGILPCMLLSFGMALVQALGLALLRRRRGDGRAGAGVFFGPLPLSPAILAGLVIWTALGG